MMLEKTKAPLTANRRGLYRKAYNSSLTDNNRYGKTYNRMLFIPSSVGNTNKYALLQEKQRLVKMLLCDVRFYAVEFTDKRHKVLCSCLDTFLNNFPCSLYTAESFLYYLSQTGAIERCGGAGYVQTIFQGIG